MERITLVEAFLKGLPPLFLALNNPNVKFSLPADDVPPLKKFLQDFFETHNDMNQTWEEGKGEYQTATARRRSIGDIYRIVLRYYPDATLSEVYNNLIALVAENIVHTFICLNIRKRVYMKKSEGVSKFNVAGVAGEPIDEFNIDLSQLPRFDECPIYRKEDNSFYGTLYTTEQLKMEKLPQDA
jgi:hypothetical protein